MGNLPEATLLVIDNYDSFTHNLVQMFLQFNTLQIHVVRSDKISIRQAERMMPDYLLVSPGPKDPASAGISNSLIRAFAGNIPILGVCLGMQCINEVMGGKTVRAPVPVHGKTSRVYHSNRSVFKGVPSPFTAARYHSLMVDVCCADLTVTARSEDGIIMGITHKTMPLSGVQFHPESFMTEKGFLVIENFLNQGPLKHTRITAAA